MVKRWSGKEKQIVEVPCPEAVHQYNAHMGGVDLADMLTSLYRIKLGTKKLYHHILYYCIELAVVNGWILYKRHQSQMGVEKNQVMSSLDFQSRVAASLSQEKKPGPGRQKLDTVPKKRKSVSAPLPTGYITIASTTFLCLLKKK